MLVLYSAFWLFILGSWIIVLVVYLRWVVVIDGDAAGVGGTFTWEYFGICTEYTFGFVGYWWGDIDVGLFVILIVVLAGCGVMFM